MNNLNYLTELGLVKWFTPEIGVSWLIFAYILQAGINVTSIQNAPTSNPKIMVS